MTEFEEVVCATCIMPFQIPKSLYERRLKDGAGFWCPAGHSNCYPKPADSLPQLRERVAALEAENRELKTEKARLLHELDQLKAKHGVET